VHPVGTGGHFDVDTERALDIGDEFWQRALIRRRSRRNTSAPARG